MNFASDNWASVADPIAAALTEAASGPAPAYGGDALTRSVEERFAELFETDVAVFLVGTGTAANTLALSAYARPGGLVFCHEESHINTDEGGAAEFLVDMKLIGLEGAAGKLSLEWLNAAIDRYPPDPGRHGQPAMLSLSNLTEAGTAYPAGEIAALAGQAREVGLAVHMDGARFGNAVAGLDASPADLTWRAGVDVLSFGGTKGGCWQAEAIVFFNRDHAKNFGYLRKRAGHTISKHRFIAAQFDAYLKDGLWLKLAAHANDMAQRLGQEIESAGGRLAWSPAGNELFAILTASSLEKARAAGATYYDWEPDWVPEGERPGPNEKIVRLVTSFATKEEEVQEFAALLRP